MSQFESNPYAGMSPQSATVPGTRPTSGLAITSLVLGLVGLLPCIGVCTAPIGLILGIISAATTGPRSPRKGRGLAIVGIVSAVLGLGVQYVGFQWFQGKFIAPVMNGPRDAMIQGAAGDYSGFRSKMAPPASVATDAEIQAFFATLEQRYGKIQSVSFDQTSGRQPQPSPGSTSQVFPYVFTFERKTLSGESEIVFADQSTGGLIMKPSDIRIIDPDLGDITFPLPASGDGIQNGGSVADDGD